MKSPIPEQWRDLPNIRTRSASLTDDLGQCAIAEHGDDRITLLLPTDGIVALLDVPKEPTSNNLRLAFGRVVAVHAAESTAPARPTEAAFTELQRHGFAHGVVFRGPQAAGWIETLAPDFQQCGLRIGGESALVYLLRDGVLPLAWAYFSTREPADAIVLAAADLLIAHHVACGEGRAL